MSSKHRSRNRKLFGRRVSRRLLVTSALLGAVGVGVVLLSGCDNSADNNSDNSSESTTTTMALSRSGFQVNTPDGQVSLSLDGKLPPGWPSTFPVPQGSAPAGSGSLAGDNKGLFVGVFTSPLSATDTFQFYVGNSALTVGRPASVGTGEKFVGTVELTAPFTGRVTVVDNYPGSLVIATLKAPIPTSTTPTSTTVLPASSVP